MLLLEGEKCYLRILQEEDATIFTELLRANKNYWTIFEPRQDAVFYKEETQKQKIRESLYQMRSRREYNFGVFDSFTNKLIGHISLYNIKRLPFSSGFIGYSIDEGNTGRGIGTEAVRLVRRFAFEMISLHRIEAYVSPKNKGSIILLERASFIREGLLRQLLYINGVWEDHYMYAIIEEDYNKIKSGF